VHFILALVNKFLKPGDLIVIEPGTQRVGYGSTNLGNIGFYKFQVHFSDWPASVNAWLSLLPSFVLKLTPLLPELLQKSIALHLRLCDLVETDMFKVVFDKQ